MVSKLYQFVSPESSEHTYLVKTSYDLKMAQKMFYEWQRDHIQKEDQWTIEVIQDPKNWITNVTGIYVIE